MENQKKVMQEHFENERLKQKEIFEQREHQLQKIQ